MEESYKHLEYEERVLIGHLLKEGVSIREISRQLGRAASTVSREIRRANSPREYRPYFAQQASKKRRKKSYHKPQLKSRELQEHVIKMLRKGLSPEQTSGRLEQDQSRQTISHEAIYQFIYKHRPELAKHLCRHHAKRKKFRHSKKVKKPAIPQRIPISERPLHIANRQEIGHWESDTVNSTGNVSAVEVLVERKSRYVLIRKLPSKSGQTVATIIISALKTLPPFTRKTLTYDNGGENAGHRLVNYHLGTKSYFCEPYHSWQKGTVENTIGLIRRIYSKKTDFRSVPESDLKRLQNALNNRPRKCLDFKTPMEVMSYECVALQT